MAAGVNPRPTTLIRHGCRRATFPQGKAFRAEGGLLPAASCPEKNTLTRQSEYSQESAERWCAGLLFLLPEKDGTS